MYAFFFSKATKMRSSSQTTTGIPQTCVRARTSYPLPNPAPPFPRSFAVSLSNTTTLLPPSIPLSSLVLALKTLSLSRSLLSLFLSPSLCTLPIPLPLALLHHRPLTS